MTIILYLVIGIAISAVTLYYLVAYTRALENVSTTNKIDGAFCLYDSRYNGCGVRA